ncbi:hypothetical protein Prudu_013113 [Prunus dulcis]|uniref:Uncharacterized protein n=1 Tax=Prunus dulcis TaxID=3755 RepID=A0A4Y1RE47_PRUDU|nr:hypothetical protein Prudu_013113 [Prunus dulcis]
MARYGADPEPKVSNGRFGKTRVCCLGLSGDNYLSWVLDAKIHLRANGFGQTIIDENDASPEENANAMIFFAATSMKR